MVDKSTTSDGMLQTGKEFEACFNDINGFRKQLLTAINAMPYNSMKASPTFVQKMNEWDGNFDVLQRGLLEMRDIMVPQAQQIQLTEEDNINTADFFNPSAGQPIVVDGPKG
jgi:hypothetical protein